MTIKELFDQMRGYGAGHMALTTKDEAGRIRTLTLVAEDENAQLIYDYLESDEYDQRLEELAEREEGNL